MNQTFQLKNRNLLSLPSGMWGLMSLAQYQVKANKTMRPKGFRTMAHIQGSMT